MADDLFEMSNGLQGKYGDELVFAIASAIVITSSFFFS
jgi:hypothetical protein